MKRYLFLLLIALSAPAKAQSEVYFRATAPNPDGRISTELTLIQSGQANQLRYSAEAAGSPAAGSPVRLRQEGDHNLLEVELGRTGQPHAFTQQGDYNVTRWQGGSESGPVEVIQQGNGNLLLQTGGTAAGGAGLRIEQSGGIRMHLQNGPNP
ncbi:hypothetical protein [Larkinella soli]|uniref:hypothetical protein n=1 Tax=Larkinella soli TaxID=1770527 RepID=UPI000FFCA895|nr:hypothetical protein [Larkinella soli]